MNRLLLLCWLGLGLVMPLDLSAQTSTTFVNDGTIFSAVQIPQSVVNFVNRGIINITTTAPFETFDTLNYTNQGNAPNSGVMIGSPGFLFTHNPSGSPFRQWASSFFNHELAGVEAEDGPRTTLLPRSMVGHSLLRIWATNIITGGGSQFTQNPGARASLIVGANGLLDIWGGNVDLSRSGLEVLPPWNESIGSVNDIGNGVFYPDLAIHDQAAIVGNFAPLPPGARMNSGILWNGQRATSLSAPPIGNPVVPSFTLNDPHAAFYIAGDPETFGIMMVTNYVPSFDPADFIPFQTNIIVLTNLVILPTAYFDFFPEFETNFVSGVFEVALASVTNTVQLITNSFVFTAPDILTNAFTTNAAVVTNIYILGNTFAADAIVEQRRSVQIYTNTIKGALFAQAPPGFFITHGIGDAGGLTDFEGAQVLQVTISTAISNAVTGLDDIASVFIQDTLAPSANRGLLANVLTSTRPPEPATARPVNYIMSRNGFLGTNSVIIIGTNVQGVFTNVITSDVSDPPAANFFTTIGLTDPRSAFFDDAGVTLNNSVTNPAVGAGNYSGYSAFVDNIVEREINSPFATETNRTGRVNIVADRLDLTKTRIRGEGIITIETPHLLSSSNTVIDCQSLSLDLSSTNTTLLFRNLSKDIVERLQGTVNVWSAIWTNSSFLVLDNYVLTNGTVTITNIVGTNEVVLTNLIAQRSVLTNQLYVAFHTMMVDGRGLTRTLPVTVHDLALRSPEVIMDDNATVTRTFFTSARSFTLNGVLNLNLTQAGELPGISFGSWFGTNAPQLAFLTNNGIIAIPGEAHFGDDRGSRYSAFVNRGVITADSIQLDSTYFADQGELLTWGVLTLTGDTGWLAGGYSDSDNDTSIFARNLILADYEMIARGAINFTVTNHFGDLGPEFRNELAAENGFNLYIKPQTGDLLGTDLWSVAPDVPFALPIHRWAAADRGPSPAGFSNNAAIGTLTLLPFSSGGPIDPVFVFRGVSAANAMYVDFLDLSFLSDYASQLVIEPNLTIYYARADLGFAPPDIDGVPQTPEEFLNGQFQGRLRWVPGYAGPQSSVETTIDGQNVTVNAGLLQSWINRGIDPSTAFQLRPLSLQVFGNGTVAPFSDGQLLIVGQTNWITAQAGPGAKFMGWFGSIESESPDLEFVMEEGLELVAVFSFAPTAASYNGLFYNTNGIQLYEAGAISFRTTGGGKYSGWVQLPSGRYSFTGMLDEGGQDFRHVPGTSLFMEIQASTDRITGTIGDDFWTGELIADRALHSTTNKAPFAGRYTIVFPGSGEITNTLVPFGDGYGTVAVDTSGRVRLQGTLADGTRIIQSSAASAGGFWPLFVPLYKGQGHLLSWQTIQDTGDKDIGGEFNWIKEPTFAKYYPDGFNFTTNSFGSRVDSTWMPLTGFSDALVFLAGGNLAAPIGRDVVISSNNKITVLDGSRTRLMLNKSNGTFRGSTTESGARPINFGGVVLQKQGFGSGYFLGTNQSGRVLLRTAP